MGRRKRLPPHVRRCGNGYRAVLSIEGTRRYCPVRVTPEEASADAEVLKHAQLPRRLVTLRDGLELVLEEVQEAAGSPHTAAYYRNHFRCLETLWRGTTPLHAVTEDQIRLYIRKRQAAGISASTIASKELQVLERILNLAERRGFIGDNPMRRIQKPKHRSERFDWIPAEQLARLVEAIRAWPEPRIRHRERDADIVALAFYTGMRRAELARVRRQDVDWDAANLCVRGKAGDRYIPITTECAPILARLLARNAKPAIASVRTIEKLFARWQERLGEPRLSPHVMRHSYGSALARAGVSPFVIRDLLGHTSLQMSLKYVHRCSDSVRSAANLVSLHGASSGSDQAEAAT